MAKNDDQDIDELLKQLGEAPDISEGMAMAITDNNEWITFENEEQAQQWHNEQVEKRIEKTEEMWKTVYQKTLEDLSEEERGIIQDGYKEQNDAGKDIFIYKADLHALDVDAASWPRKKEAGALALQCYQNTTAAYISSLKIQANIVIIIHNIVMFFLNDKSGERNTPDDRRMMQLEQGNTLETLSGLIVYNDERGRALPDAISEDKEAASKIKDDFPARVADFLQSDQAGRFLSSFTGAREWFQNVKADDGPDFFAAASAILHPEETAAAFMWAVKWPGMTRQKKGTAQDFAQFLLRCNPFLPAVPLVRHALDDNYMTLPYWQPGKLLGKANSVNVQALQKLRDDSLRETVTGVAVADDGLSMQVLIDTTQKVAKKWGVGVAKLFQVAAGQLAINNHFPLPKTAPLKKEVSIPFDGFARALGRRIDPEDDTPKEKQRAKDARKNAKKRVTESLNALYSMTFIYRDQRHGLMDVRLIQEKGQTVSPNIMLTFSDRCARILSACPRSTVPTALFKIDNNDATAYLLGLELSQYYNMYANQDKGRNNRRKVASLLSVTDLPTYKQLQKTANTQHWTDRIKEPFERALDTLTAGGVLQTWEYCKARGIPLTDQEAAAVGDKYENFAGVYVKFELQDAPDLTEQRQQHREKVTKRIEKAKNRASKRKATAAADDAPKA